MGEKVALLFFNRLGFLVYSNKFYINIHTVQFINLGIQKEAIWLIPICLIGELKGYSWSGVRPSVPPSSVVNNFKHLLLKTRLSNQSQILSGASLGRANESLFAACGLHYQDGHHAHIWYKPFKSSQKPTGRFSRNLVCWGIQHIIVCSNDDPGVTLTYFTAMSNLVKVMEKQ